jgi:hypothetical protein
MSKTVRAARSSLRLNITSCGRAGSFGDESNRFLEAVGRNSGLNGLLASKEGCGAIWATGNTPSGPDETFW